MNTAQRLQQKEDKKAKIIGKLSIIVGANRKGDIVAREGDSIETLVKSFMTTYGLKKEVKDMITKSLEQAIRIN